MDKRENRGKGVPWPHMGQTRCRKEPMEISGFYGPHVIDTQSSVKGTQSTDHNQWPDLILSSSSTTLLINGVLLHLHRLFNNSMVPKKNE